VPTQLRRSSSQRSAPPMARHNSRGTSSQRSGNLPFTQTGTMPPPLLHTESRRENPTMAAWTTQEQPLSSYNLSHQAPQLQRSMSQRAPEMPQVLEGLEDPSDFLSRTLGTPAVAVSPSLSIPSPATLNNHRLSTSSFNMQTPSTPTSDSLTTATTLTSNMSRQSSLCNDSMLQSMEMMNCNSQASFSTDMHDQFYTQITPHFSSSHHSRRSSNEEQSQLLVGTGASHELHFSHSYQIPSSGFGEKMEKCQSNESTSSSSSSRSLQRLQAQNNPAAARRLVPKGGEDNAMSRENSSHSMSRQSSKDGSDKVAISKPSYQRPKHDRVYCKLCDSHSEGFRGEHELRRHQDREHKSMVKKWVCLEPNDGREHPKPVLSLMRCKACNNQKKKYGAYYNAAAHLRRAHFKPKSKGKPKNNKGDDGEKRGGKGGGDWPPMSELKYWMKEVEEPASDYPLAESQQEDVSDDETLEPSVDERTYSHHTMQSINTGNFDSNFLANTSQIPNLYPAAVNFNEMFGTQNIPLDPSPTQQNTCMEQSIYSSSSQNSFHNFSPNHNLFQNDPLAFLDTSLQNFDDQILAGPDFVNFSYQ